MLHPAVYDSGGMAAWEGLAWGLPGVGFDLLALKTYYPQGMLKAPQGDINAFADLVIKLLEDENLYKEIGSAAIEKSKEWDWGYRARKNLQLIKEFFAIQ